MYRSKFTADRKQHGSSSNSCDSSRFPGKRSTACYVGHVADEALRDTNASTDDDDSYTDEYAYALDGGCNIPVLINGVGVDIVIDSGASCNTINTDIAKQLKETTRPLTIVAVSSIRMALHQSLVNSSRPRSSRLKAASLFRPIFSLVLVTRPHFWAKRQPRG